MYFLSIIYITLLYLTLSQNQYGYNQYHNQNQNQNPNYNVLGRAIIQILDETPYEIGPGAITVPTIIICPLQQKCKIICVASSTPRFNVNGNIFNRPNGQIQSACGLATIIQNGLSEEFMLICEQGACIGTKVKATALINKVECIGIAACTGAEITCGRKVGKGFMPVQVEICEFTCSNGGCAGDPGYNPAKPLLNKQLGLLPGARVLCQGNMISCLVKANSQVQGYTYSGSNQATQYGSGTSMYLGCSLTGFGVCVLECSDSPGQNYCNQAKIKCKTASMTQCRCTDSCPGGRCPRGFKPDCPIPEPRTLSPTMNPTGMTNSPTRMPTISPSVEPTGSPTGSTNSPTLSTSGPSLNPTVSTVGPTGNPTKNPVVQVPLIPIAPIVP